MQENHFLILCSGTAISNNTFPPMMHDKPFPKGMALCYLTTGLFVHVSLPPASADLAMSRNKMHKPCKKYPKIQFLLTQTREV